MLSKSFPRIDFSQIINLRKGQGHCQQPESDRCGPGATARKLAAGLCCLLLGVWTLGCAPGAKDRVLADLQRLPQNPAAYVQDGREGKPLLQPEQQANLARKFRQRYFRPWRAASPLHSEAELYWGVGLVASRTVYAAKGCPYPETWVRAVLKRANRQDFPSRSLAGMTLRTTHLRVLPTQEPVFFRPDKAGQGYPFDMMQNSVLWTNTPVQVVHTSRDGAWLLVETAWVFGWARAEDIGFVDQKTADQVQARDLLALTRDNVSLPDRRGMVRSTGHIGTLLPLISSPDKGGFQVLLAVPDTDRRVQLKIGSVPPGAGDRFPLVPQAERIADVAGRMQGQMYGWGGLYARRDCSASMRDLFTPFGVWLPRNSSRQGTAGRVIELSGLSAAAKERIIRKRGVPFLSLLWKPGHIMLYVGQKRGRAAIFHTLWGLKTWTVLQGQGRQVVGRSVITSLRPGEELPHLVRPDGVLVNSLQHLVLLGEDQAPAFCRVTPR